MKRVCGQIIKAKLNGFIPKTICILASFLLASLPVLPVVATTVVTAANTQSGIDAADFSVVLNKQHFPLGDKWDEQAQKRAGIQHSEAFVGDVPAGNSSYKFLSA